MFDPKSEVLSKSFGVSVGRSNANIQQNIVYSPIQHLSILCHVFMTQVNPEVNLTIRRVPQPSIGILNNAYSEVAF